MSEGTFGLTVQRLATADAVLALAQVAGWRGNDRWFASGEVTGLYRSLRVPEPANISAVLGRLRSIDLVRDNGAAGHGKRWALTPEGELRAEALVGDFDYATIAVELQAQPGAYFADAEYPTLPPTLAPPAWAPGIRSFVERHPFPQNVFLMTRFPREAGEDDPLAPAIQTLREAVSRHGLTLHTADQQQIVDDLWGNVGAHMWACRYGVGILETRAPKPQDGGPPDPGLETLNDNVLIELGSMLTIGRRCMILKDREAPMPPTDLTAQVFKEVDLVDLAAVSTKVDEWVERDLRIN